MRRLASLVTLLILCLPAAACGTNEAPLPGTAVAHEPAEIRQVFALEGVALEPRSHATGVIVTFGDRHDILEVDVFGDPQRLRETGFRDVQHPTHCANGAGRALRWKNNVRAIVNCDLTRDEALWLSRVERAFGHL